MSSFSDYLENELLDHVFGNLAFTSPTTVYAALYTVAPTDAGGGTEVSGAGYARQAVTFGAPASRAITNSADVDFTASGGNFGDVLAVGIFDASTAGNLLAWDGVTTKTVNDGDTYTIATSDLDISFNANGFTDFLAEELLDHVFRNNSYTAPTTVYSSLYTVTPTDSTAGTEVTGSGYARMATAFGAASGGVVSNTAAEAWTASGGSYGAVIAHGLMDASTAGNLLAYAAVTSATVADGDTINFAIGEIDVTLS